MWRILRWLPFGHRNLTLAELEVVETGASKWYGFATDVGFLCGFIHQTARTFEETSARISSPAEIAGINMDIQTANERLAITCIHYLLRDDHWKELSSVVSSVFASESSNSRRILFYETLIKFFQGALLMSFGNKERITGNSKAPWEKASMRGPHYSAALGLEIVVATHNLESTTQDTMVCPREHGKWSKLTFLHALALPKCSQSHRPSLVHKT